MKGPVEEGKHEVSRGGLVIEMGREQEVIHHLCKEKAVSQRKGHSAV